MTEPVKSQESAWAEMEKPALLEALRNQRKIIAKQAQSITGLQTALGNEKIAYARKKKAYKMLKQKLDALEKPITEEANQWWNEELQHPVVLAYTASDDKYMVVASGSHCSAKFVYQPTAELIEKIRSKQRDSAAVEQRLSQLGWKTWRERQPNQTELELAMTEVVAKMVEHIQRDKNTSIE